MSLEELRDLEFRYRDSLIYDTKSDIPCWFERVFISGDALETFDESYELEEDTPIEIEVMYPCKNSFSMIDMDDVLLEYPDIGFVNGKDISFYFNRSATRQYKRGLTTSNSVFTNLLDVELDLLNIKEETVWKRNMDVLNNLWFREYPTLKNAYDMACNGSALSVGFDKNLALVVKCNSFNYPMLYYKTDAIGYVTNDNNVVLLTEHLYSAYKEYLSNYFTGIEYEKS